MIQTPYHPATSLCYPGFLWFGIRSHEMVLVQCTSLQWRFADHFQ